MNVAPGFGAPAEKHVMDRAPLIDLRGCVASTLKPPRELKEILMLVRLYGVALSEERYWASPLRVKGRKRE